MERAKVLPLLHFFVLILACYLGICMAIDNITITQPLRDPGNIFSSSQTFKLGFFSLQNTSVRYVGIMYNVPLMTVVWVANRDKPLNDSAGTLTITDDGNLVVLNRKNETLWSTNISDSARNRTAQLLDTGNLVLKDSSSGMTVWESFQFPTDSFLPKMKLSAAPGTIDKLNSWASPSNPSRGNFFIRLQTLPTTQLFIWNKNKVHWRSGPWSGNLFIGTEKLDSEYLNGFDLVDGGSESAYFTYRISNDWEPGYHFYHLTVAGVLEWLHWGEGNSSWEVIWLSMQSQCDTYSKCGPFGSCNSQNTKICTCLKGFEPSDMEEWDRGNWTQGCSRKTPLQCERNNSAGQDGFITLQNMKVPDFVELKPTSAEFCGELCLRNCSCLAYSYYTGIGCMHWSDSLVDVQQFSDSGADLYVRVAHSELGSSNKGMKAIIASTVVAGILVVVGCAYAFWMFLARHRGKKHDSEELLFEDLDSYQMGSAQSSDLKHVKLEELPLYTYESLLKATGNFHSTNKLGKGGFGEVYKGKLPDGKEIAVKRLSRTSSQGTNEFMNEVLLISKLQHRNLVRLLGCCVERGEKMLIYEYMPNGSLDSYLFDSSKQDLVDWSRRVLIIEGIGRGLLYLHRDSRLKIIHRDLKASNILLDEELNPKISDFGLARILGGKQDQDNTRRVVGTYGYMSPEYAMVGRFSEKSDVYSFGVLLIEIITGRRNSSFSHGEDELSLIKYVWKLWNEGGDDVTKLVINPLMFEPSIEMEIKRYIQVGLLCVQELEKDRPNVSTILSMLNSEIPDLPPPKLPAFTGNLVLSEKKPSPISPLSVNDYTVTVISAR